MQQDVCSCHCDGTTSHNNTGAGSKNESTNALYRLAKLLNSGGAAGAGKGKDKDNSEKEQPRRLSWERLVVKYFYKIHTIVINRRNDSN